MRAVPESLPLTLCEGDIAEEGERGRREGQARTATGQDSGGRGAEEDQGESDWICHLPTFFRVSSRIPATKNKYAKTPFRSRLPLGASLGSIVRCLLRLPSFSDVMWTYQRTAAGIAWRSSSVHVYIGHKYMTEHAM